MLRKNVILVGFMGTGKSSTGRALASRLRMRFVDLDRIIEHRAGKTIARIFAEDGETAFRELERKVVAELTTQRGLVVATGGGVVLDPRNIEALDRAGTVVCLTASVDTIMERVAGDTTRPLLAGERPRERVMELLEARRPVYESFARRIDTSTLAPREVAERICAMLDDKG
jgi:shikimate kinase